MTESQGASVRHLDFTSSTTWDETAPGIIVRVSIEGDGYMVRDCVGLRYGFASNLPQAIEMWAHEVQWMVTQPREKLGGPALREADAYRQALPHG